MYKKRNLGLSPENKVRKNSIKLKNRGVSQLISAILLVAITITIGAMVMRWGVGNVESQTEKAELEGQLGVTCQMSIALSVKTIAGEKRLCFKNTSATAGVLEYTLENKGSDSIAGIMVALIGINDTSYVDDKKTFSISAGGVKKGTTSFNFTGLGEDVVQVTFAPYVNIEAGTGPQLCRNMNLVEDDIYACT
ncbi:hypothetical protein COV93_06760 [Candidatus Woesearchaeota archaeon CG11_big_fil_rev_8_21_14_0_20_43_8]|nr:MAG: hypothetical protein COV93_06760 [Candidatus Woesearchaeota archaeon CG11_big_fil_rev_8_21_14_0_20_43_8]